MNRQVIHTHSILGGKNKMEVRRCGGESSMEGEQECTVSKSASEKLRKLLNCFLKKNLVCFFFFTDNCSFPLDD